MQIKKKNNTKIIIIAVAVLLVVAGGITTAVIIHNRQQNQTSSEQPKDENDKNQSDDKENTDQDEQDDTQEQSDNNQSVTDNNDDKTPPRYEGGSVQNSNELTGSVSISTPVNNTMIVRATINQLVGDPNGTCTLNLAGPQGQTYSEQVKMIDNPQTSSCYGWDIPTDKVGFTNGKWKVTVFVNGGGRSGTFTSEVNL